MSIESHFEKEGKLKKSRRFHDVVDKLLNENKSEDTRPWRWEEEITENDWKMIIDYFRKIKLSLDKKEIDSYDDKGYGKLVDQLNLYSQIAAILYIFNKIDGVSIAYKRVKEILSMLRNDDNYVDIFKVTAFFRLIDSSVSCEMSSNVETMQLSNSYYIGVN